MRRFHRCGLLGFAPLVVACLFIESGFLTLAAAHNAVILLVDASGSLKRTDPECRRGPAAELLIGLLETGDKAAILEFGDGVSNLSGGWLEVSDATRASLVQLANQCATDASYTNIVEAIEETRSLVAQLGRSTSAGYRVHTVLLTDGRDTAPGASVSQRVRRITGALDQLDALGARVHTVGLSEDADAAYLAKIAEGTGGEMAIVNSADDLGEAFFALARVVSGRWNVAREMLAPGEHTFSLPDWCRDAYLLYVSDPWTKESTPSIGKGEVILDRDGLMLARVKDGGGQEVQIQTFASTGKLVLDATGDLEITELPPTRVPSAIPFGCTVRLAPRAGAALGEPAFLKEAQVHVQVRGQVTPFVLFDNGQHGDGAELDGVFGGTCSLSGARPIDATIELSGPFVPHRTRDHWFEPIVPPLKIERPSSFATLIASWSGSTAWHITNATDVPLVLATPSELSVAANSTVSSAVNVQPQWLKSADATMRVVPLNSSEEIVVSVSVPARGLTFVPLFLVLVLVIAANVLPRRNLSSYRISAQVVARGDPSQIEDERSQLGASGSYDLEGLRLPFSKPGQFRARHGLWRKGVVFTPSTDLLPKFKRGKASRKGRVYVVQAPATWECQADSKIVTYRLVKR